MDWIMQPWPWYVSGAAIAIVMLLLLLVGKITPEHNLAAVIYF